MIDCADASRPRRGKGLSSLREGEGELAARGALKQELHRVCQEQPNWRNVLESCRLKKEGRELNSEQTIVGSRKGYVGYITV